MNNNILACLSFAYRLSCECEYPISRIHILDNGKAVEFVVSNGDLLLNRFVSIEDICCTNIDVIPYVLDKIRYELK